MKPIPQIDFERACARLRTTPDFRLVLTALEQRLDVYKTALLNKSGEDLTRQQGMAVELSLLIQELNALPKE
jgi:hypothetical protein